MGERFVPTVGRHCMVELHGCPHRLLDDAEFVARALREAARAGNATLLNEVSHRFEPHGITALALLSESHLSIHTWPEFGFAAADAFTCGLKAQPEEICRYLVEAFQARHHTLVKLVRGGASLELEPVGTRAATPRSGGPEWNQSQIEEGTPCRAPGFAQIIG